MNEIDKDNPDKSSFNEGNYIQAGKYLLQTFYYSVSMKGE